MTMTIPEWLVIPIGLLSVLLFAMSVIGIATVYAIFSVHKDYTRHQDKFPKTRGLHSVK